MRKTRALKIEVMVESPRWKKTPDAVATMRRAVAQAAAVLATPPTELAIVLTDDSTIRRLNQLWRGSDTPTNVLSFPSRQMADAPPHLGDIVLAFETIAREARAQAKPFAHHIAHLAVHGFLHLVGHDHARSKEAETMERLERDVLRRLDIPDPYRS